MEKITNKTGTKAMITAAALGMIVGSSLRNSHKAEAVYLENVICNVPAAQAYAKAQLGFKQGDVTVTTTSGGVSQTEVNSTLISPQGHTYDITPKPTISPYVAPASVSLGSSIRSLKPTILESQTLSMIPDKNPSFIPLDQVNLSQGKYILEAAPKSLGFISADQVQNFAETSSSGFIPAKDVIEISR